MYGNLEYQIVYQNWNRTPVYLELAVTASYETDFPLSFIQKYHCKVFLFEVGHFFKAALPADCQLIAYAAKFVIISIIEYEAQTPGMILNGFLNKYLKKAQWQATTLHLTNSSIFLIPPYP